jgi:hypothetical protein
MAGYSLLPNCPISSYREAFHCYSFCRGRNSRSFPCLSVRCCQNAFHRNLEFPCVGESTTLPRTADPWQYAVWQPEFHVILDFEIPRPLSVHQGLFASWLCSWNVDVSKKWYSCQKFGVGVTERSKQLTENERAQIKKCCKLARCVKAKRRKTRLTYIYTLSPRV